MLFWKCKTLETCPPLVLEIPANKKCFEASQMLEQLSHVKSQLSATLMFFSINGKMDLEKLVWTPSISAQLLKLLSFYKASRSKTLVLGPQSQGGKIWPGLGRALDRT